MSMRQLDEIINDILKVTLEHYDLVEANIWDRIPLNGKRKELWERWGLLYNELRDFRDLSIIRKIERTGTAMVEDVVPIEHELSDIKKELQRMYVLIHKLQYPPNNDIKVIEQEEERKK